MAMTGAHKGFACFNDLLEEYQPKWFVHGHVHLSYNANLPRVCTHGQTTVINATERYTFEIPDPDPVARRRFFWNDPGISHQKTEKGETPNGTK